MQWVLFFVLGIAMQCMASYEVKDYPYYRIVSDCLTLDEQEELAVLLNSVEPVSLWYGRFNLYRELYYASIDQENHIELSHLKEINAFNQIGDRFTLGVIQRLIEDGMDLAGHRILVEFDIDRAIIPFDQADEGLFWHRDAVYSEEGRIESNVSAVLLLSDESEWVGGDLLIQKGGEAGEDGSWIQSDRPICKVKPFCNQAVIFENRDAGHALTPMRAKSKAMVNRDLAILSLLVLD